ncbi:MAG: TrbI/VirB10 family protein [Candidatus Micrarchaeia archaeon]
MARIKINKEQLKGQKNLIFFGIVFFGIIFVIFTSRLGSKTTQKQQQQETITAPSSGLLGVPMTEIATEKIEERQQNLQTIIEQQQRQIEDLKKEIEGMKELQKNIDQRFGVMQEEFQKKTDETLKRIEEKVSEYLPAKEEQQISPLPPPPTIKTSSYMPITKEKKKMFLPAGAFVKGTLLTGVFAPADKSNPLPVLIAVDEAFYGPNLSRVPLKGAFTIGKCVADINSSRAIIQLVSFSYIYPDGRAIEKNINGYVAGDDGILGVQGEVIRRVGKELAGSFMSGFMSGLSEAFALKETTQVATPSGVTTAITGSATKYGLYSGLASASQKLSDYYAKQLEEIITAVKVEKGKKVYLVIQQGVEIET